MTHCRQMTQQLGTAALKGMFAWLAMVGLLVTYVRCVSLFYRAQPVSSSEGSLISLFLRSLLPSFNLQVTPFMQAHTMHMTFSCFSLFPLFPPVYILLFTSSCSLSSLLFTSSCSPSSLLFTSSSSPSSLAGRY